MEILRQLTALVAPGAFQRCRAVGTRRADRQDLSVLATAKKASERNRARSLEFLAHMRPLSAIGSVLPDPSSKQREHALPMPFRGRLVKGRPLRKRETVLRARIDFDLRL